MPEIIAYCGLHCSTCEAYVATRAGDPAALQAVAEHWRVVHNNPSITAAGIPCDGCLTTAGRTCFHCAECGIRACARERGMENCAHCADYGCDKMAWLLEAVPDARARLDGIRAALGL